MFITDPFTFSNSTREADKPVKSQKSILITKIKSKRAGIDKYSFVTFPAHTPKPKPETAARCDKKDCTIILVLLLVFFFPSLSAHRSKKTPS